MYDPNGSLVTRTDAKAQETYFEYDALNRIKIKSYSRTSTPQVNYYYDNQTLPSGAPSYSRGSSIGRLVVVTFGGSYPAGASEGSYFGYDEVGRGAHKTQQLNGNNYPLTAGYNRASMMTGETYPSNRTANYTYNTAGQLATFYGNIGDGQTRTYVSSATYNAAGQKEYGYRSGQLLVVGESGNVRWLVTDHLGSTRMTADSTGSLSGMKRQDYLPFGEDLYAGIRRNAVNGQYGYEPPTGSVRQKFTGYERDSETGLDYAQARYFSNTQGRFTSTDPLFIEMKRLPYPQAWNLYAHTRNNPLRYVDPDGLDIKVTCANGQLCDETVTNLNNRKNFQFKVELKDGKLAVVGKVDASKLSKSEGALYRTCLQSRPQRSLLG